MKKKKLSKVVGTLAVSAILFTMPVGAFMMNSGNLIPASAQTTSGVSSSTAAVSGSSASSSTAPSEDVSGNDAAQKCTCTEKCTSGDINESCPVCKADYQKCEYVAPNVKITIETPSGWYNDSARVNVSVKDLASSGHFEIATVKAKIAQNGSWTDITEDMALDISENCTVYVEVTDQNGKTYSKNRSIKCFDFIKPTLNAAINNGRLSVKASDTDSGIKAIYVDDYEFTDLTNGAVSIQLQKFDAGYQKFSIEAMDNAGNMSEVYQMANPYYKDPSDTSSNVNPADSLPASANPTDPLSATAQVTSHTVTDADGNSISSDSTSMEAQKKQAFAEADAAEAAETGTSGETKEGKEFYTIEAASGKVFYLIIDRSGDTEQTYFLTEITENDLLNVTDNTSSDTLPQNAATTESALPATASVYPNNNTMDTGLADASTAESSEAQTDSSTESVSADKEAGDSKEKTPKEDNPTATYIFLGIIGVIIIVAAYILKIKKRKGDEFLDEDEDDEGDDQEYENEDEETSDKDDFFENSEEEDTDITEDQPEDDAENDDAERQPADSDVPQIDTDTNEQDSRRFDFYANKGGKTE
ncbi:MAG: DUF4366 domain-containing protein [Butyrivibrio sp.]|jgi:hypothetical protein|nr:DUF4366 domain-containing protein [Butyrivibrio sp.]